MGSGKKPASGSSHLASLKQKYFSAGNRFLQPAWLTGRNSQGTDVLGGRAKDAEPVELGGSGCANG